MSTFYGSDLASIHDERFGDLAVGAAERALEVLAGSDLRAGTVVDLGCGSGILAARLTEAGYRVHGVDLSADMVALARDRAPGATFEVGSLFDVPIPAGTVAVTAIGEALNYAADPRTGLDQLAALATRARDALVPGGLLLFDVATPGRGGTGGAVERFHRGEHWALGMHATEAADGSTLERWITVFTEVRPGQYRRSDEHHVLRLYRLDEVVEVLSDAGFAPAVLAGYGRADSQTTPAPGWAVVEATTQQASVPPVG